MVWDEGNFKRNPPLQLELKILQGEMYPPFGREARVVGVVLDRVGTFQPHLSVTNTGTNVRMNERTSSPTDQPTGGRDYTSQY